MSKEKIKIERATIENADQIGAFLPVNEVDAARDMFREHGQAAIDILKKGAQVRTRFFVYQLKKD